MNWDEEIKEAMTGGNAILTNDPLTMFDEFHKERTAMVRLDRVNGGGLFVSHRNTFMTDGEGPSQAEGGADPIVEKARFMFAPPQSEQAKPVDFFAEQRAEFAQPEEPSKLGQLDAQVEKLTDRFEQMEFTFAETSTMIGELRAELSDVAGQISGVDVNRIVEALGEMRDSHATAMAAVQAPREKQPDPMIATMLEQMQALRSDMSRQNQLSQRLESRIDGLTQQVDIANAAPDPAILLQDQLTTRLDAVNAVIARIAQDQVRMAKTLSELTIPDALSGLADDVSKRFERVDATMAQIAEDQSRISQAQSSSTVPDRLSALGGDLARRFESMEKAVARLAHEQENAVTRLMQEQEGAVQSLLRSALHETLPKLADDLSKRIELVDAAVGQIARDQDRMAQAQAAANVPEALSDLSDDVAKRFALVDDAMVRIGQEQNRAAQALASSTVPETLSALGDEMAKRFEVVNAVVARIAQDQERMARAISGSTLPDKLTALGHDVAEQFKAVGSAVSQIGQDQNRMARILSDACLPETLSSLRNDVNTLAERGDPVLDLTAQREGFAQFNKSADVFLRRLEHLVATMASDHVRFVRESDAEISSREAEAEELAQALRQLSDANMSLTGLLRKNGAQDLSKSAVPVEA